MMNIDLISVAAALFSGLSALYAGHTRNEARKANEFTRSARKIEDFFTLMEFLHREEHRNARMAVLAEHWDAASDIENAWKVCSSFDFAGLMVQNEFVDRSLFFKYWNPVIPLLAKKLEKFIAEWQCEGTPGTIYWKHFVWLIERAQSAAAAGTVRGHKPIA